MYVIHLVRKALKEPTIFKNVIQHGTGALHTQACLLPNDDKKAPKGANVDTYNHFQGASHNEVAHYVFHKKFTRRVVWNTDGRFPANVILVHKSGCTSEGDIWKCIRSCPIYALDQQFKGSPFYFKQVQEGKPKE